ELGTFRCRGCGRALKVPETVPRTSAPQPQPAAPTPPPASAPANQTAAATPVEVREPTRVMPLVTQNAAPPDQAAPKPAPATGRAKVPWWMQLPLWIVAVPLAYFLVFLLARATGLFSSNQLSDVFLANGFSRFWPLARLLPIVALVTALLVQGGV